MYHCTWVATTGNGYCRPVNDTLLLVIDPAPVVLAGDDEIICSDRSTIPLTGVVHNAASGTWTASGTGAFNPANSLITNYSVTPEDTTRKLVSFRLESTGNNLCNQVVDYRNLVITPAPAITAGPDIVVCFTENEVDIEGAVTYATGISWTSSGTGTFLPGANASSTVYQLSDQDKTSGNISIYAESMGTGGCNIVRDTMAITIVPLPVANAGTDITICADSSGIAFTGIIENTNSSRWSTISSGVFSSLINLTTTYYPSAADTANGIATIILTANENEVCPLHRDTMIININPAPVVIAGEDITVCGNNSLAQLAGIVHNAAGGIWTGPGSFSDNETLNPAYSPTTTEISSGRTTLTLTSTGNGLCKAIRDHVNIIITPAPTADAGPDIVICANNSDAPLSGRVTIASGGEWIGGDGIFSNGRNELTTVYTPSQNEILSGEVILILQTTGNGDCLPVIDSITITITPAPIPNAGTDITVCANNPAAPLSGNVLNAGGGIWTSGTGTYSPSNNDLAAVYTPSRREINTGLANIVLVTTNNGTCLPVTDTVQIIITPAPVVNAGTDIKVCADTSYIPLNGIVTVAQGGTWSSTGTGSFINEDSLSSRYLPSVQDTTNGTLVIYFTSRDQGNCLAVRDSLLATITPAPVVNAGTDQQICKSENQISLVGNATIATGGVWTSSGTGGMVNNAEKFSGSYSISTNDKLSDSLTFTLTTIGNSLCKPKTDNLLVRLSDIPTIEAGASSMCAEASGAPFKATYTGATGVIWSTLGSGSFSPSATLDSTTYMPSAVDISTETVTIRVTTTGIAPCQAVSDEVILTISPTPQANVGNDFTICADSAFVNLSGTVQNSRSIRWTSHTNGAFSPSQNSAGTTYTPSAIDQLNGQATLVLTVQGHPLCSPAIDTLLVTITPAPTIDAGVDTLICPSVTTLNLNGNVTVSTGGTWTTTGSGLISTLNNPTTYHITEQDRSSGEVTFTITSTGNGMCKAVTDSKVVSIKPEPFVTAGPHQIVCSDVVAVAFNGMVRVAEGGIWTSSGTGEFFPNDQSLLVYYKPSEQDIQDSLINIYFTSTGNTVCRAVTDSISLRFVNPPVVNAGTDRTVCIQAREVQLNGTVENADGGIWTGGSGTFLPNNALITRYPVASGDTASKLVNIALTSTNEGCFTQDSVQISIYPAPSVTMQYVPACDGEQIRLTTIPETVNATALSGFSWKKNNVLLPEQNQELVVRTTGIYSVFYQVGECLVNDTTEVRFHELPKPQNEELVKFCPEAEVPASLDAGPAHRYVWEGSQNTGRILETMNSGTYYFSIFNQYNCSARDSIKLRDVCPPKIFPHNAFSPNDDGLNEFFIVHGGYYKNFSITIFNRWGEIIFYSTDPKKGWDGNYRNEPMPPGVYPYIIKYEAEHSEYSTGQESIPGSVTLIR